MENAQKIETLKALEYAIRNSITVREDQEEDANQLHAEEAWRCGISPVGLNTKGDLLNAVQTVLRALQVQAGGN